MGWVRSKLARRRKEDEKLFTIHCSQVCRKYLLIKHHKEKTCRSENFALNLML